MTELADPKRIVDEVLAASPASSLDVTVEQRDRLKAVQDELLRRAQALSRELDGGKRLLSGSAARRDVRTRSLSARWARLLAAQDRLDAYVGPLLDFIDEQEEVVADG